MTEVVTPARAKVGYIATKRYDKAGRVKPAKDAIVPFKGMMTTKEAERVMRDVAEEHGADPSQIRLESYADTAEAPMSVNPRHRGRPGAGSLWTGWSPPTPEELASLPPELVGWGAKKENS